MIIKTYQVARHLFRLELPVDKPTGEKILKAYAPFETQTEEPPLFTLHLHLCQELPVPPQEQLLKHFDQELPFLWAFQSNIGYTFGFSLTPGKPEALVCDTVQPTEKTLYLCETSTPEQLTFGLHNALMLTFTRQTAPLDTLLIHSSVICKDQQGYAFLGKSGTGKSTHSRLWLQHIPGSELLNDDNPVIRICHGTPVIFGSPWSGKTPCYKKNGTLQSPTAFITPWSKLSHIASSITCSAVPTRKQLCCVPKPCKPVDTKKPVRCGLPDRPTSLLPSCNKEWLHSIIFQQHILDSLLQVLLRQSSLCHLRSTRHRHEQQ